jgi:hypothetical protein
MPKSSLHQKGNGLKRMTKSGDKIVHRAFTIKRAVVRGGLQGNLKVDMHREETDKVASLLERFQSLLQTTPFLEQ